MDIGMERWSTETEGGQQRDDPEATGKSAGVRLHLVNKNRNTHSHNCQYDSNPLYNSVGSVGVEAGGNLLPVKIRELRSDDVTLMSGLGQHRPK